MKKLIFLTILILFILFQNNGLLAAAKQRSTAQAAEPSASAIVVQSEKIETKLHTPEEIDTATKKLFSILRRGSTVLPTVEDVELAIKNGANLNALNQYGETPLVYAIIYNYIEIVKLLLKMNADVNVQCYSESKSPLIYAVSYPYINDSQIVELFLKEGSNMNRQDKVGTTALMIAAILNRHKIVKLLLEKDADVNFIDNDQETFFDIINKPGKEATKDAYVKFFQEQSVYQMSKVNALRVLPPGLLSLIGSFTKPLLIK